MLSRYHVCISALNQAEVISNFEMVHRTYFTYQNPSTVSLDCSKFFRYLVTVELSNRNILLTIFIQSPSWSRLLEVYCRIFDPSSIVFIYPRFPRIPDITGLWSSETLFHVLCLLFSCSKEAIFSFLAWSLVILWLIEMHSFFLWYLEELVHQLND